MRGGLYRCLPSRLALAAASLSCGCHAQLDGTGVPQEKEIFIHNLLVPIQIIIVMMRWTGPAPWEFEFPLPGSSTSTFQGYLDHQKLLLPQDFLQWDPCVGPLSGSSQGSYCRVLGGGTFMGSPPKGILGVRVGLDHVELNLTPYTPHQAWPNSLHPTS